MHTASYVSLSTRSAPLLDTKNYWLPFYSGVTNVICLSIGLSSTHVCVLLHPTMSYINSAQFETYRRNIPSSPLCLRRFFSRKTRFYRFTVSLKIFYLDTLRGWSGRGMETYDEKSPRFDFQKVRKTEKSGCAMLLQWYDIFTGSPDVRHDLSHTVHIVVETNLLSEDVVVSMASI